MKYQDIIIAYKDMKSIKKICEELSINYSNLINGLTTEENERKVVDKLKIESYKIFSLIKLMEDD